MRNTYPVALIGVVIGLGVFGASASRADTVSIVSPFLDLENRAINSLGFTPGEFLRIGATSVTPNGLLGTTGVGTTVNLATGQTVTRTINFNPGPVIPNFFSRNLTDDPNLYGPWTLTFSNGGDSSTAHVSLPSDATQVPFLNTITLSGTSAVPTFTWAPPPGVVVNGYRINIYDKSLINNDPTKGPINNGQVTSKSFAGAPTYTVTGADFTIPGYSFQLGHNYSIEIGLIQTKDGTSNNLGNNINLKAISRVYADFTPTNSGTQTVNLPVTLSNGSFQFDIAVVPGKTYYIDPAVATGYDYRTGAGDPNFASVVLPTGIGDGLYDLYGLDSSNHATLLAHDLAGGDVFDFSGSGVSAFRVDGIETSAGLDPASSTAFVTGLTFEAAGTFTGTQTPIVTNVGAIPEPQTYALMLIGLGSILALRRRQRLPDRTGA